MGIRELFPQLSVDPVSKRFLWLNRTQSQLMQDHIAGRRRTRIARTLLNGGFVLNLIWLFT